MPLDFNELRELLLTLAQTDIVELTLKSGDFELTVRKGVRVGDRVLPTDEIQLPAPVMNLTPPSTAAVDLVSSSTVNPSVPVSTPSPARAVQGQIQQRSVDVPSPMVGTFYSASTPGEASFVEVGDRISIGQTVCIIEAMKLMNEIEAEVSGQVIEILVQNGETVEYGQALMRIKPD